MTLKTRKPPSPPTTTPIEQDDVDAASYVTPAHAIRKQPLQEQEQQQRQRRDDDDDDDKEKKTKRKEEDDEVEESEVKTEATTLEAFDPFDVVSSTTPSDHKLMYFSSSSSHSVLATSPSRSVVSSITGGGGGPTTTTTHTSSSSGTRLLTALPPRLTIKMYIHEEVASMGNDNDPFNTPNRTSTHASIAGSVQVSVHSSDATKNTPFGLILKEAPHTIVDCNDSYVEVPASPDHPEDGPRLVYIPKSIISKVELATYASQLEIRHMPILVQRKLLVSKSTWRLSIQVRSNLRNKGDLHKLTICVALPKEIFMPATVVTRDAGEGSMVHQVQRTIQWTMAELPRGKTVMVNAQGTLDLDFVLPHQREAADANSATTSLPQEDVAFDMPVVVRCTSYKDVISCMDVDLVSLPDLYPSTVVVNTQRSFRLLHRVP